MLVKGNLRLHRHLLRLVAEVETQHLRQSSQNDTPIEVRTARLDTHAVIQVVTTTPFHVPLWIVDWQEATEDVRKTWLLKASCQSMAVLADVKIRRERSDDGRSVTSVKVPFDPGLES